MLNVEVDTKKVERRIADMQTKIAGMPQMSADAAYAWQVDDMHRRYPSTDFVDDHTVEIDVFPRSRLSRPHRPTGRPAGRPRGQTHIVNPVRPKQGRAPSQRPILRPELFTKLVERLQEMLRKITWA